MKKIAIALMAAFALCAATPVITEAAAPKTSSTVGKSLKTVFQNAIGKYPYDVKLLQNATLKARLVKLMGQSRFNVMSKNFDVETPIEFSSWNYHTTACQAHNCGNTDFEISYNPDSDALAVKYRVNGKLSVFKEKPSVNAIWDY